MVARAFIFGLTPRRTLENTFMGSVVAPGPATKLDMTRSSKDRVNANSQAEAIAGAIIGIVIVVNTLNGGAPRSK